MVERFVAGPRMSEAEADTLAGTLLDESSYDRLIHEDCDVLKPDGTPLLVFRRNVLPADPCREAWSHLRKTNLYFPGENNRGLATGRSDSGRSRALRVRKDGTASKTDVSAVAATEVKSGIIGYFDRYERIPYCRQTAFNLNHPDRFRAVLPFIRSVDAVFARAVPDRHAAQFAVVRRTAPDFVISGTAFTTITVNRNWQTAVHQDKGDYRPGFGVMTVLQAGHYDGGFLVFPRYRVAVDMRSRDLLMADVHEWHGNTPIVGVEGKYERISCVFYYRESMHRCGSAAEEQERAKRKKPGQGRWG